MTQIRKTPRILKDAPKKTEGKYNWDNGELAFGKREYRPEPKEQMPTLRNKCRKPGHVMKCRNVPRQWTKEDGTVQFKIYVQVFCDTCKKEREALNNDFRLRKYAQAVAIRSKEKNGQMISTASFNSTIRMQGL